MQGKEAPGEQQGEHDLLAEKKGMEMLFEKGVHRTEMNPAIRSGRHRQIPGKSLPSHCYAGKNHRSRRVPVADHQIHDRVPGQVAEDLKAAGG